MKEHMKNTKTPMKIGAVVKLLGIPASTLRYYEKTALIKPTSRVSNARCYDEATLFQLRFIQMAQAVGFSISEIKQLLAVCSTQKNVNQASCETIVDAKLVEVQQKISDLQKMQAALAAMNDCHCSSLQSCVELGDAVKAKISIES